MKFKTLIVDANDVVLNHDQIANLASEFYGSVLYYSLTSYKIEFHETKFVDDAPWYKPEDAKELQDQFIMALKPFSK